MSWINFIIINHIYLYFFQVPPTTARLLLNCANWDTVALTQNFFESDDLDHDKKFSDVKFVNPLAERPAIPVVTDGMEECGVCFSELPTEEMFGLDCAHRFCKECWAEYISSDLKNGAEQSISCASYKCPQILQDDNVLDLVTDLEDKSKYQRNMLQGFVEVGRNILDWMP